MSITELIKAVGGDEAVNFQNLDQAMIRSDAGKDGVVKITFGTQAITVSDLLSSAPLPKLGLVVWLDRSKAMEAIAKSKEQK